LIAFVEGLVHAVRENSVVIGVGGFGLEVLAPRTALERCRPGESARLETYLLVREDALALYGFSDSESLDLFRILITVSGVGPKLGLALLSSFPVTTLAGAILDGDVALLASTPGVGRKTAERLSLELQAKLPAHLKVAAKTRGPSAVENPAYRDAVEALVALGYREAQVRAAIAGLLEADPAAPAETLIRKGLSKLR
jgi:Holliday junction DNA helicase RuvA